MNLMDTTNTAFWLYAMEQEGELSTRQGKINKVIKLLAQSADPNDFATQCAAYNAARIDSDTFTDSEINYIEREVARRRGY